MAKIDFIYECSDCGAEIKKTVTKPERHWTWSSNGATPSKATPGAQCFHAGASRATPG